LEASPQQPSLALGDEFVSDDEQVVRLSVHHRGGSVAHGSLRADVVAQGNGGCTEYRRVPRFAYCPNLLLRVEDETLGHNLAPHPQAVRSALSKLLGRSCLTSLCGETQRTMLVSPTGSATVTRTWRLACPLPLTRRSNATGCREQAVTVVEAVGARQSAEPVGERLPTTNGA
jgi:hypothetical protein